jgi:DNA-binding IclR family transcriptional regulator
LPPNAPRPPASSGSSGGEGSISLTLAKGLAVLSAFRAGETYLSNRELAERTGYTKPTVSRLARTLLELGYLRYSASLGRYALGPAVLTLSYPMLAGLGIRHIARPFMHELAEEVAGQVSMGMRDRHAMVFVESARSRAHRLTLPEIGATMPLLASSMGRAYVAALDPAPREALLAELEQADPDAFARYAEPVREAVAAFPARGFACSFGEVRREMFACATPLRVRVDGEPVVVNCGVPAAAMSREEFVRVIGPRLVAAARSIDAAAGAGLGPDRPERAEAAAPRLAADGA